MRDIEQELADYALAVPYAAMQLLEAFGTPRSTIARAYGAGWLGMARCSVSRGLWEPDGDARRLVLAVHDEHGDLIDLLAISSTDRDFWAMRRGDGWLLGAARFHHLRHVDMAGPMRIFGTPLDWLKAGGWFAEQPAICVLDWTKSAIAALRELGPAVTLVAEDRAAAEALREVLRFRDLPGIEVQLPGNRGRMAA